MISDYEYAHEVLFGDKFPKKMVEFGLGVGTQFFLDRCEEVTSIELYTSDQNLASELKISNDYWMKHFKEVFKDYKNWNVIGVEIGNDLIRAEKDIVGGYGLPRGSDPVNHHYQRELGDVVQEYVSGRGIE
jgi:hypothetical protein